MSTMITSCVERKYSVNVSNGGVKQMDKYDIIRIRGHYEAYLHGKFICSGDTETEVENEIQAYESEVQGK